MKHLKFLMCGILMVSLILTSCKKDAGLQRQKIAPQQNIEKLFEKSLIIYNADKTNSTTLRFSAATKALLDEVQLKNIEFTLVETPESANEPVRPAIETTPGNDGSFGFSESLSKIFSEPQGTNEERILPADGVLIDLPFAPKTKSFALDVKSKLLNNGTIPSAKQAATLYNKFYYHSGWHRIKVTNLYSTPIWAYFYYYYSGWHYTGYQYKLYKNYWAYYYNCSRTVGALVYYYYYHSYRINYYSSCH